jgi:CBS-domain-containing membrane protein
MAMERIAHRLITLKVKDVMSRLVTEVSPDHSMSDVALLLIDNHVTGAPVVDDRGRCIGMLSAVDYVKRGCERPEGSDRWSDVKASDCMSTAYECIRPEQTMLDAARLMCVKHVHRLPVLDRNCVLVGLITSMDITAALVNAMDEHGATDI